MSLLTKCNVTFPSGSLFRKVLSAALDSEYFCPSVEVDVGIDKVPTNDPPVELYGKVLVLIFQSSEVATADEKVNPDSVHPVLLDA